MKKSLAIKLHISQKSQSQKKSTSRVKQINPNTKNAKTSLRLEVSPKSKLDLKHGLTNIKPPSYRNKNLSVIPASLLSILSSLTSLDISHNKLTDSQIEILMGSCPKLETLCIQGNLTGIIPSTIIKMKCLERFRHDWVKLFPENIYQTEPNLRIIKFLAKQSNSLEKTNNILGITFKIYCNEVIRVPMNEELQERVKDSQCSYFAQNQMTEAIILAINGNAQVLEDLDQTNESMKKKSLGVTGCFNICGFDEKGEAPPKDQKWKEIPFRKEGARSSKQQDDSVNENFSNFKIQKIRDISETSAGSESSAALLQVPETVYQHSDMPMHMLVSKFDSISHGVIDLDRLLLKGYNPNTYDRNGLSPYHVVVIFRQEKALERLMQISFKNPGFFDLEMPSLKEGRNILHYCVFLKDYQFAKNLIEFGFPLEKRDCQGARALHLVDQNYEFLLLLRKLIKRKMKGILNPEFVNYPQIMMKKYTRHPPRVAQQSNYQTFENKNMNLLEMYETAVGFRNKSS